jgi:hypothetical protein
MHQPAGWARWQHIVTCGEIGGWGHIRADGPVITGNGTSTAVCDELAGYDESTIYVLT